MTDRVVCILAAAVWIVCAGAPALGSPASATALATGAGMESLPAAALDIVRFKCTQCHGPDVSEPKAGFGYVTDARRLVQGGKVVPGKPEESLLFRMVGSGKMPPSTARNGTLSPQQVQTIRQWIAAGAPEWPRLRPAGAAASGVAAPAAAPSPSREPVALAERIGRLHLQLVHFPIALLLAALLAEGIHRFRPTGDWRLCARYCLWVGAIGAAATAGTGWLLESSKGWSAEQEEFLETHEWLGTATAILAAGMVALGWFLRRRAGRAAAWVILGGMLCLGVLVSLTGHFGGLVAWGGDFLPW